MSDSPISSDNTNSSIAKRSSRYRVYVWVITTSTVLLIALLAWPLTVKQFATTAEVRLTIDPTAVDKQSKNELIAMAVAQNTSDENLSRLVGEIESTSSLKSELLRSADPARLRDRIQVATRVGRTTRSVDLRLTLVGHGSRDEVAFVNRLSNAIATDLTAGPARKINDQLVQDWIKQFTASLEEQNDFLFQASGLLNEQLVTAIDHRNQLYQRIPDMAFTEPSTATDEISSINIQHQIAQTHEKMKAEQLQNNWPANHPQLLAYQNQIDGLRNRLNQLYQTSGTKRVTNQFINVASSTKRETSMDKLLKEIKFTELDTSSLILEKMQKQLQQNQTTQKQMLGRMGDRLSQPIHHADAVRLERLRLADSSKPLGGSPNPRQLAMIGLLAVLLGSVMTWQYKPELRRRHFHSAEHASAVLGIPTIGVLRETETPSHGKQAKRFVVTGLFRCCEYILLCLAILLILAMLVNSEIFGNMMENPFQAISKLVWIISPR